MTMIIYVCFLILVITVDALDNDTTPGEGQKTIHKQGWTPQPDGRGTLDILWTCVVTMSLCSWSILCLNMPGTKESKWVVLWRKFAMTGLGVLCPEIMTTTAVGQWVRARQCVQDFNENLEEELAKLQESQQPAGAEKSSIGEKEIWTMQMAYFADMGGFRLRTKNGDEFPLDAKQIYYLTTKGYIKQPIYRPRLIDDKNKVDVLLRTIILCQISWFLISVIGRWVQRLFVTTAELTTVSFILCRFVTSEITKAFICKADFLQHSTVTAGFWWHKPADVVMAEIIKIDVDTDTILNKAGIGPEERDEWRMTPLDFVSRKEWWWSRVWWNFLNILRKMHFKFGSGGRPTDRLADSCQHPLGRRELYMVILMSTVCFSVFFTAWKHDFPTWYELMLWRAASIALMVMLYMLIVIYEVLRAVDRVQQRTEQWRQRHFSTHQSPRSDTQHSRLRNTKYYRRIAEIFTRIDKALNCVRNNSPDGDKDLSVPLRVLAPVYVMGFFYCASRVYIMIADILELRSLPPSAYATVKWEKFWPHLG